MTRYTNEQIDMALTITARVDSPPCSAYAVMWREVAKTLAAAVRALRDEKADLQNRLGVCKLGGESAYAEFARRGAAERELAAENARLRERVQVWQATVRALGDRIRELEADDMAQRLELQRLRKETGL